MADTFEVFTREFVIATFRIITVGFVTVITTIVFMIALPRVEDTPAVLAPILIRLTCMIGAESIRFVTIVLTVIRPITCPQAIDALAVGTGEMVRCARVIQTDTHLVAVHQFGG